jgi:hypothetical protein
MGGINVAVPTAANIFDSIINQKTTVGISQKTTVGRTRLLPSVPVQPPCILCLWDVQRRPDKAPQERRSPVTCCCSYIAKMFRAHLSHIIRTCNEIQHTSEIDFWKRPKLVQPKTEQLGGLSILARWFSGTSETNIARFPRTLDDSLPHQSRQEIVAFCDFSCPASERCSMHVSRISVNSLWPQHLTRDWLSPPSY